MEGVLESNLPSDCVGAECFKSYLLLFVRRVQTSVESGEENPVGTTVEIPVAATVEATAEAASTYFHL